MNTSLRRNSGSARTALLCLIAAVGGAGAMLFFSQKEKNALQSELAALHEQARQAEAKSPDPKEVEKLRAQVREAEEFKKEAEEVHRLRGEVTLLRKDKAMFEQAKAENTQLREQAQLAQRLQTENATLRGQYQSFVQNMQQAQALALSPGVQAQKNSCIANLKQIDGAVQQWALENRKVANDPYSLRNPALLSYLKGSILPLCPAGGRYTESATISGCPTCTVAGHTL